MTVPLTAGGWDTAGSAETHPLVSAGTPGSGSALPPGAPEPGPRTSAADGDTSPDPSAAGSLLPGQSEGEAAGPGRTPRVIGLDLSLTSTGIASSAGWCELIGAKGITAIDNAHHRYQALAELSNRIMQLLQGADLVVVELLTFNRTDGGRGGASERAGLYWLMLRHLTARGIPVAEVGTAGLKKYATGVGAGKKNGVIDAAARRWPQYQTGGDDNLADAVVLMAMGRDQLGQPLADMPKTHRAALAAVAWPEVTS